MSIVSDFQNGVNEALKYGQQVRLKYYTTSYGAGSYYDDDVTLTQSGTDYYISGVILPISQARGSSDALVLEQGRVLTTDTKLYIEGAISTSGIVKYGLGSPVVNEYELITDGTIKWNVNEVPVLKKLFIRQLTNGSFIGE